MAPLVFTEQFKGGIRSVGSSGNDLCFTTNGGDVTQEVCDNSASQDFVLLTDDADPSRLRFTLDGQCLGTQPTGSSSVLDVVAEPCDDADDGQVWTQSGNLLVNQENGYCLDVSGGNNGAGGQLITYVTCHGNPNQQFELVDPPAPAILAVTMADARDITGNFFIDNGALTTNNGIGRNLNAPENPNALGTATFDFNITEAGNYKIRGSVRAPNGSDDSFWITLNGVDYKWGLSGGTNFHDDFVNDNNGGSDIIVYLEPGAYPLTVSVREDGASIASLEFIRQ